MWVIVITTDACDTHYFLSVKAPRTKGQVIDWLARNQDCPIIEFTDEDWRDYTHVDWYRAEEILL